MDYPNSIWMSNRNGRIETIEMPCRQLSLYIPQEAGESPLNNPQEYVMPSSKSEILQGTLDLMVLKTMDAMGPTAVSNR
jgi:hypothetical protein